MTFTPDHNENLQEIEIRALYKWSEDTKLSALRPLIFVGKSPNGKAHDAGPMGNLFFPAFGSQTDSDSRTNLLKVFPENVLSRAYCVNSVLFSTFVTGRRQERGYDAHRGINRLSQIFRHAREHVDRQRRLGVICLGQDTFEAAHAALTTGRRQGRRNNFHVYDDGFFICHQLPHPSSRNDSWKTELERNIAKFDAVRHFCESEG